MRNTRAPEGTSSPAARPAPCTINYEIRWKIVGLKPRYGGMVEMKSDWRTRVGAGAGGQCAADALHYMQMIPKNGPIGLPPRPCARLCERPFFFFSPSFHTEEPYPAGPDASTMDAPQRRYPHRVQGSGARNDTVGDIMPPSQSPQSARHHGFGSGLGTLSQASTARPVISGLQTCSHSCIHSSPRPCRQTHP